MIVVWQKARFAVALSLILAATTTALCIANLVDISNPLFFDSPLYNWNGQGGYFGELKLGLATLFMSLVSNVCATLLVGLKVWYGLRNTCYDLGQR